MIDVNQVKSDIKNVNSQVEQTALIYGVSKTKMYIIGVVMTGFVLFGLGKFFGIF